MNQQCNSDVLLACLREAAREYGLTLNEESVLARLPLTESGLTPELFLQAADRLGFDAEIRKQDLDSVSLSDTPLVVLLKENQAAVYLPGTSASVSRLLRSDQSGLVSVKDVSEVGEDYIGYQIVLRPRSVITGLKSRTSGEYRDHWFWGTMWRYRKLYLQLLPASVLVNLFALAMPFFVMIVYDRVVPNQAIETLWVLAIGVALVFTFDLVIRLVRGALLEKAGRDMDMELASTLYAHLLSLSMRAVPASTGNLTNRIRSYENLREFFVSATLLAIADMPFALLMIAAIFYLAGPIGWVLVIASVLAVGVSLCIQFPLHRAVRSAAEVGLERQAFIGESVGNLEPIKLNNAEGYFQRQMNRMLKTASAAGTRSHWYSLLANSLTTTIVNLTSVVVVVSGVYQVSNGFLSMGGLIACVMLSSRCMAPMTLLSGLMTRFQQALQSLESLTDVMSLEKEAPEQGQFLQHSKPVPGFEFRNASLSYRNDGRNSLSDISLSIGEGEKVALLGRIGSGKSTLLKVMAGLQPVTGGSVTVDKFELSQFHPATLRSIIGYVPQEAALFYGSLRDNVALGNSNVSDAQILQSLQCVGLGDFVRHHPQGLLGEVGERGCLLSGGQRRAITLARCLVQERSLLLLDEPTANLDPQTERNVIETLKRVAVDRTLVIATHKSSVLELVDRVIVLDRGRVVSDEPVEKVLGHLRSTGVDADLSTKGVNSGRATVSVNQPRTVEVQNRRVPQGSAL